MPKYWVTIALMDLEPLVQYLATSLSLQCEIYMYLEQCQIILRVCDFMWAALGA